jgi:hypothetical protein
MATALRHFHTVGTLALPLALPLERIAGRLLGSGAPVTVIHAGTPATADFIAGALFEVDRRSGAGQLKNPLQLRSAAFRAICADADLAVMELPPLWRFCLPAGTRLRMPAWISQEIQAAPGAPLVLPPELRKEAMRHCRREGYEVEFMSAAADIRRFYDELYRPYVTARFGDGAVLVDEQRFLDVARDMTLAILCAGSERIAGILFRRQGTTLHLGWFGSATVPPRAGASEALDVSVIERAATQGIRRVVMGHSRPRMTDGVVRYKGRFGAIIRPTRFPQRVIGLQVLRSSPALTASLDAARFLVLRKNRPVAYQLG